MIPTTKSIGSYVFGAGSFGQLEELLDRRLADRPGIIAFFVDGYFKGRELTRRLPSRQIDRIAFVDTSHEPTTEQVDAYVADLRTEAGASVSAVVGIGGGSTMDIAKAVSNLLTNEGLAEDYQGWDLVQKPGVFKIGVPTLSGTGAEASRTCVMMNRRKHTKLGMNSAHTLFDQLVLDPDLTKTVPREQYFYTGMDTYVHCVESLAGRHRHPVADAYSREALRLCREIFFDDDMQSDANREKIMVASLLGGTAIANSYVGVIHPLSAGLSMVLGTPHCLANCLVINVLGDFYPEAAEAFHEMMARQRVSLPSGLCRALPDDAYRALYQASIVHEKPLSNALGPDFHSILTFDRMRTLFQRI